MRAVSTLILGGAMVAGVLAASPLPAHAGCEVVCYTAECRPIPGGQRCRRVCRRRCWIEAPRFYAPPEDDAPRQRTWDSAEAVRSDPLLMGLGLFAIVIVIAILAASASADTAAKEIEAIEKQTFSARAEARDTDTKIQAIASSIASAEADAFEQGRRAADDEWKEFTRDD